MADDVIPGSDSSPENPFRGLFPNFGQEARGWARQQVQSGRQELRSTVDGAENQLFEALGLHRDGRTISGNIGGVGVTRTGSDWSLTVDDVSFSRSRSGINLDVDNAFHFANSPSGWSIRVGNALDFSHSASETRVQLTDPSTNALFSLDRNRQGFDLEGRQLQGTSFKVEKSPTGESLHVESDGLAFDIRKTGSTVSAGIQSPQDGSGYIFTEDPLTKTLSIYDLGSGSTLSIQRTGMRTFKVEESQLPHVNFQPSTLLDRVRQPFPLPQLSFGTDVENGQGRVRFFANPVNIGLSATGDVGPVTLSVQATQNYNLTNLLTRQGRSHPLDAVLGRSNVDVSANFGDQLGAEFSSGNGQNPSIRLVRGLGSGDLTLGGEYNLRTHNGTIKVQKNFGEGCLIQLNASTGSLGFVLRFER